MQHQQLQQQAPLAHHPLQHHQPQQQALPQQPPPLQQQQQQQQQILDVSTATALTTCAAPTIKNHSVTHFGRYLYCFGGYDGRRNHTTLLIYDLIGNRWIRPIHYHNINNHNGLNPDASVTGTNHQYQNDNGSTSSESMMLSDMILYDHHHSASLLLSANVMDDYHPNALRPPNAVNSNPHNTYTPNMDQSDSIIVQGTPPPGRNGHSATLAVDENSDGANGRIVIIGGWLGTGPLAASDTHILDVSCHGKLLRWYQPTIHGTPPGPCNMHSADYVTHRKEVYVFRGGNGREYLNDLHALHVPTLTWRKVITTGEIPQQRANHSSAILEETNELFIFGGWNGTERLNDIHILDTRTSTWTFPKIYGILPHPRAGMTLTALRGRLYLFGGSGQLAK